MNELINVEIHEKMKMYYVLTRAFLHLFIYLFIYRRRRCDVTTARGNPVVGKVFLLSI